VLLRYLELQSKAQRERIHDFGPILRSVEFHDIFIFDCVSALHHQAIVVVGFPEESGVLQVFCEIAMHVRSSVLDTSDTS